MGIQKYTGIYKHKQYLHVSTQIYLYRRYTYRDIL